MKVTTALMADAAIVAEGKLYIHGGAWDTLTIPPGKDISWNVALVLVFQTEYHEAQTDLGFQIQLVDADLQPAGVDFNGFLRTGHSAAAQPGDAQLSTFVAQFNPLVLPKLGAYVFRVIEAGAMTPLAEVPFRAVQLPG